MNYEQTVAYLLGIRLFGIKLGLQNIRALLELMGRPHQVPPLAGRFMHIAGTNGKGSVAAMLNAIGQRAGLRVGLFTSPHLVSFCERFQVNDQPMAEPDVVRLVGELRPLLARVAEMPEHAHPTFFEVVTAMALSYFQEQRCELVVWETGMGGRLDATNVVTPMVSIITNVQNDHAAWLGDTIEKIAGEKAGIIKPGVPVVTAAADPQALAVIERAAAEARAPLTVAGPGDCRQLSEDLFGQHICVCGLECFVPLVGSHQLINAATAVTAARIALKVPDDIIRDGLAAVRWPGRFQVLPGRPTLILDGAHNPDAAMALGASLDLRCCGAPLTLILGINKDKDYDAFCKAIAPRMTEILTVQVRSERTADPAELAAICRQVAPEAIVRNAHTLSAALEEVRDRDGFVVVTGSFFLVGEALALLKGYRFESGLNQ